MDRSDIDENKLESQIHWGWMGQICAGSFGTALEIAFLLAMNEYGNKIESSHIAEYWISLIPFI